MAYHSQTFEGGTNGQNVGTASLSTSGEPFDVIHTGTSGSVTLTNTPVFNGSLALSCVADNVGDYAAVEWTGFSSASMSACFYFRFPAASSAAGDILAFRANSFNAMRLQMQANNTVKVLSNSGGTLHTTAALSVDTWYRMEMYSIIGTGSTDGTVKFKYYVGDSLTATGTYESTTINAGTTNFDAVRVGWITNTSTSTVYVDDLAVNDVARYLGVTPVTRSRPATTDSNAGSWTVTGGSTANEVTEDSSDTTYITTPDNPTNAKIVFKMDNLKTGTPAIIVRAKSNGTSVLTSTLKEGTTTIASWQDSLTASWTNYRHELTPTESNSITDRNNLFLELDGDI